MKIRFLFIFAAFSILGFASLQAEEKPTLVLGAGCFWCVEAVYERLPGVLDVVSGYAGGTEKDPTYQQVAYGRSSHAEVVKITYDPKVTSLDELLDMFWKIHDATDPRGVWPDFGPQYRSIILYANDHQKKTAALSKEKAGEGKKKPIATQLKKLNKFYPAEDYHQDYVKNNPNDRYVRRVAIPKLKKAGLKP